MIKQIAKALVKRGDQYMILLRPDNAKRYPSTWDLPGGKLETDEDFVSALAREIKEETGIKAEITNLEFSFETDEIAARIYNAYTEDKCRCELNEEHCACRWVTLEELKALPDLEIVLENYIKTIS